MSSCAGVTREQDFERCEKRDKKVRAFAVAQNFQRFPQMGWQFEPLCRFGVSRYYWARMVVGELPDREV